MFSPFNFNVINAYPSNTYGAAALDKVVAEHMDG
jgi:hypothetical protein